MNWKKMFQYRTEPEVIIKEVPAESTGASDERPDLLDEEDAAMVIDEICRLEEEYFGDLFPLDRDRFCRKFVANIKPRFLKEMRVVKNRNLPDILSPFMLLYPAFTDNAGEGQGTFLLRLEEIMNENREAIIADDAEYRDYLETLNDDESSGLDEEEEEDE